MSFHLQPGSLATALLVTCLLASLRSSPLLQEVAAASSLAATGNSDDGNARISAGTGSGSGSSAGSRFYRFITDAGSVVEIENRPAALPGPFEVSRSPPFANARLLNAYLGSASLAQSQSLSPSLPSAIFSPSQQQLSTSGSASLASSPGVSQLVPAPNVFGMSAPEHRIVTRGGGKQRFCGEMLVSALALVCKGNYRKRSSTPELADCK